MKVRIVIRCATVKPTYAFGSVCNLFNHLPCRLGGHRDVIELSAGKLALRCSRCGRKSPGWALDPKPALKRI